MNQLNVRMTEFRKLFLMFSLFALLFSLLSELLAVDVLVVRDRLLSEHFADELERRLL